MIDLSLFRIGAFAGANVATFFLYFALSANLFYLPMLLIAGWGLSTAEVGFIFLPLSASMALLSGPVGRWSDRIGPRFPIASGSLVVAFAFAGLALLAHAGIHNFWTGAFPLMALMGFGMALVVSPLSTAIMTSVEDKDTGAASGINNAVSRIGGLIAVAAMGSLAAWVYAAIAERGCRARNGWFRRTGAGRHGAGSRCGTACRQRRGLRRHSVGDCAALPAFGGHCLDDRFRRATALVATHGNSRRPDSGRNYFRGLTLDFGARDLERIAVFLLEQVVDALALALEGNEVVAFQHLADRQADAHRIDLGAVDDQFVMEMRRRWRGRSGRDSR